MRHRDDRITDTDTGNIRDYTLDEGDQIEIVIKQGVTYRYEVTTPGARTAP